MKELAEKISRKLFFNRGIGNKGLTLVELVCAVTIFAIVAGTVSGVLIFSARTYQRGSTESEIQQEAQFAANRISGIIQNATEVNFSGNTLEMKKGESTYNVSLNEGDKNLIYNATEKDTSGAETLSGDQVLAGNITGFEADVSQFKEAHTVILDMTVSKNDKEYPVRYTIKARNEEINVSTDGLPPAASIYVDESNLILVPGESYTVNVTLRGTSAGFTATPSGGITVDSSASSVTITVNNDTRDSSASVKLAVEEGGTELCSKTININIRSVNALELTKGRVGTTNEYVFSADLSCNNAEKVNGGTNENNYKNPYAVEWSGKILTCGSTSGTFDTEVTTFYVDDSGNFKCSNPEGAQKYIVINNDFPKFTGAADDGARRPEFRVKLTDSFDANTKFVITASSSHAMGKNKASSNYGEYKSEKEITVPKLKSTKLIMVPGQTYILNGVRVGSPVCDASVGAGEIQATFAAGNKMTIKLTEKATGDSNGIITLKVRSQGSTAVQLVLEIYVRRVYSATKADIEKGTGGAVREDAECNTGNLRIDFQLMEGIGSDGQKLSPNGKWGKSADYQFKARVKGTNLSFKGTSDFLNADKQDGFNDYNPYAVQFNWELRKNDETVSSTVGGALVTVYEHGKEDTSVIVKDEDMKVTTGSQENEYFKIVNFALNKESPAVNIHMKKAFPGGYKLVVTARAVHPKMSDTTARNKANCIYYTATAKDKFVEGMYTLEKPADTPIIIAKMDEGIIVEPYQVNHSGNGSMTIPMHVGSDVKAIKINMEGMSEKDTELISAERRHGSVMAIVRLETKDGEEDTEDTDNTDNTNYSDPNIITDPYTNNTVNLMINISAGEEGSSYFDKKEGKKGRIKLTLIPYSDESMSQMIGDKPVEVFLKVRRVQEVKIADKNQFVNKAGVPMELKASASGIEGTDYFDQQIKKAGEQYEPVWDKNYKSPYKIKWAFCKSQNDKDYKLLEKSEYFSGVQYSEDSEGTQIVKFTLNSALPEGSVIMAISYHAMGAEDGTQHNRSGLNYIRSIKKYEWKYPKGIVYDIIRVGAEGSTGGFQRGNEHYFAEDGTFSPMRDYFVDVQDSAIGAFWRYKPVGQSQWSPYYLDDHNNWQGSMRLTGPNGSSVFLPNVEYDLEFMSVVYNPVSKIIYWPLDVDSMKEDGIDLLAPGTGWSGEGYHFWQRGEELKPNGGRIYSVKDIYGNSLGDRSSTEIYDLVSKIPHESRSERIGRVVMYFGSHVENGWKTIPGRMSTISLNGNTIEFMQLSGEEKFAFRIEPAQLAAWKRTGNFSAYIEKGERTGDTYTWTKIGDNGDQHYNQYFDLTASNNPYKVYNIQHKGGNNKGLYRICVNLKEPNGLGWKMINGALNNRQYVTRTASDVDIWKNQIDPANVKLYDETTNEGIVYIQIN